MAQQEQPDEEPADLGAAATASPATKGRRSFLTVRRELTEADLATTAVQKLLLDELDRLETENAALRQFEVQFHEKDKLAGVLQEKIHKSVAYDIYFGAMLTIGAALLSYAASTWSSQPTGAIILVCGGGLLIGGIISRLVLK